mgnify:FL=1
MLYYCPAMACSSGTSPSCHVDRRKDRLYRLLTDPMDDEAQNMVNAVRTLVENHSRHPDVKFVFEETGNHYCVARAILLWAICIEPEFATYIMQRSDVDPAVVGEFIYNIVRPSAQMLMDGTMSLEFFVNTCLVEYVTM